MRTDTSPPRYLQAYFRLLATTPRHLPLLALALLCLADGVGRTLATGHVGPLVPVAVMLCLGALRMRARSG
jgi:hypothetical protein